MPRQVLIAIVAGLFVLGLASVAYSLYRQGGGSADANVTTFAECVALGNPVLESYPRQCVAHGTTFTEDIGNQGDTADLIRVASPRANAVVESPLKIEGAARGSWFFEATFPVRLIDDKGNVLATGVARADGEWTTEEFVPFVAEIEFPTPVAEHGELVLLKDNPSGLPENAGELRIPVFFEQHNGEQTSASMMRIDYNTVTLANPAFEQGVIDVQSAVIPQGGFVVIHASRDGKPEEVIGHGPYVTNTGLVGFEISLARLLRPNETFFALIHLDDGDEKFSVTKDSVAVTSDGTPLRVLGQVEDDDATAVATQ